MIKAASLAKGRVLLLARSDPNHPKIYKTTLEQCEIELDEKHQPVATQVVLAWAGPELVTVTFDIAEDGKKYHKNVSRLTGVDVDEEWKHIHKAADAWKWLERLPAAGAAEKRDK